MIPVGIFETQARSQWGMQMIQEGRNQFGHRDVTWRRRALLAIPDAGIAGKTLTTMEMEDALIPYIGPTPDKASRACMVSIGIEHGIIEATGTWRRPDGCRRKLREYRINGHMDLLDDGSMIPVMG